MKVILKKACLPETGNLFGLLLFQTDYGSKKGKSSPQEWLRTATCYDKGIKKRSITGWIKLGKEEDMSRHYKRAETLRN